MDLARDATSINEEVGEKEDRISNLPDELIRHIMSFLDMKNAVRTSALSHKWEHIWTSTHSFNLNSCEFPTVRLFAEFVKGALSHQKIPVEVSKVQLTITRAANLPVVKRVVNNVYMHNVRELNMTCLARKFYQFPECLFSSGTLKHLTLATGDQSFYLHKASCIPRVAWNFPALETLCLRSMHLGDKGDESLDLFSKCVNLRDLTLHNCCMYGLKIFNICAPELSNLTIRATSYPDVVNVVAPKLENLTASVRGTVNQVPYTYESLQLSTEGFDSLEKVNLSLTMPHLDQARFFPLLLNLFHQLRSTKYLVINLDIIETLSLCLDQLSLEPCPFDNLKCLEISTVSQKQNDHIPRVPTQVRSYFLENSPSATVIMNLPQVPQKRSRQQEDDETMDKKVAKLKTEKKQPETAAQGKRLL
ncbi:putative F-box domain, leucine-rich repeat domain superfamily, F-box-like domain superfamily [Helianthus annuus]|nr:putative F-box domain, leucine-rich repeat domain superfamily, F-box-like domain superfamily [Helianthus annuus]KAJ0665453.1 putative F-box domain, leucine-rich repeat domain superfamily, F-box-like domain superfamily [Helianthus annuus]